MSPVPAGVIAERRVINKLMLANAVSPETATNAGELDGLRRLQARRLVRLIDQGVVVELQPGRYYLQIPALAEHLTARRQRVAIVMLLMIAVMIVLIYFSAPGIRR